MSYQHPIMNRQLRLHQGDRNLLMTIMQEELVTLFRTTTEAQTIHGAKWIVEAVAKTVGFSDQEIALMVAQAWDASRA